MELLLPYIVMLQVYEKARELLLYLRCEFPEDRERILLIYCQEHLRHSVHAC